MSILHRRRVVIARHAGRAKPRRNLPIECGKCRFVEGEKLRERPWVDAEVQAASQRDNAQNRIATPAPAPKKKPTRGRQRRLSL